jgi:hypothetical protein
MILEIASWTTLFTAISLTLPYVIPYFRNKLQQIKTMPIDVFDAGCIREAHQTQINAIDRSIGQITAAIGQLMITGWASLNLLGLNAFQSLDAFVIGYYIYDTIHLLTKPYAKTLKIFIIHHMLAIFLVGYLHVLDIPYYIILNMFYIVLEFSGTSINITNTLIHIYPSASFVIPCSFINLCIYGITRILLYPIGVIYIAHYTYVTTTSAYSFYLCLPAIGITAILLLACMYWFTGMIAKHRALKQKLIL